MHISIVTQLPGDTFYYISCDYYYDKTPGATTWKNTWAIQATLDAAAAINFKSS